MHWILHPLRWAGRLFELLRQGLVQVLLGLVYLFGIGLLALGRRIRSLGKRAPEGPAYQPAARPDLSETGLKRMG